VLPRFLIGKEEVAGVGGAVGAVGDRGDEEAVRFAGLPIEIEERLPAGPFVAEAADADAVALVK